VSQGNLFESGFRPTPRRPDWRPEPPPSLDGVNEVYLDTETTGLRWWDGDLPVGTAIAWGDRVQYLPHGHRGGGNLDEETVRRWARRELRGKRIVNLGTRFDVHMYHSWGVDLEAQGCTVSDIGHYAALLDDHRRKFSLEAIAQDYLGEGKVKGLDMRSIAQYHAGDVEEYACQDVRLVRRCKERMWPELDAQDLQRVRQLEDDIIFVVCEMERNGAPIDLPLLQSWRRSVEERYQRLVWEIYHETGLRVDPTNSGDLARLFRKLGIESMQRTPTGKPSFDDFVLRQVQDAHPVVRKVRTARALSHIDSKYLAPYWKNVRAGGPLRYALHQLKTDYGGEGHEGGTVTGRFSSSAFGTTDDPEEDDGVNVQAVMTPEKARAKFGYDPDDSSHDDEIFLVRQLYTPPPGRLWLSADAEQIEYRLFAHFANSPKILRAYEEDPHTNFHRLVQKILQKKRPDLPYRRTKDCNFAKIFGAALPKIALMMELPIREAESVVNEYDETFPEVPALIRRAMTAAKRRGYVRSLLGRRSRFPNGERLHKALNSVIQPSAADWNKMKLVELHRERHHTGMTLRFTVHDEANGDVPDLESARRVGEILNRQTMQLRVQILWKVGTGANWKECK
jgi:DNA polymerase I